MLALVVSYSSGVQQPVRATAVLNRRLHTRRAAPVEREQARASSLHPDGQGSASGRRGVRSVNNALTVGQRSNWYGLPTSLAAFWPHKDAQRCRLLRINEYRLGRSAVESAGSGCARHSLRIRWLGTIKPPPSPLRAAGPPVWSRQAPRQPCNPARSSCRGIAMKRFERPLDCIHREANRMRKLGVE